MAERYPDPGPAGRAFNKAMADTEFELACGRLGLGPEDTRAVQLYHRILGLDLLANVMTVSAFAKAERPQAAEDRSESEIQKSVEDDTDLYVRVMLFIRDSVRKR